jgi:site-specific recombinase XerD
MNRLSFSIRFFVKNKKKYHYLYVRIIVNRKPLEISLRRKVDVNKWDDNIQRFKGNSEISQSLNFYIENNRYRLISIHNTLVKNEEDYDTKKIRDIFLGNHIIKHYLLEEFYNHNEKIKALAESSKKYAPATYKRFNTVLNHIKDFINSKGSDDVNFNEINSEWVNDLDTFLRLDKKLSNNTTLKYIKLFKKIYNIALRNGWAIKDPFVNFKIKFEPVKRDFLSLEEIKIIASKKLHIERLDQVRDVFLFCCLTGLRYSDVSKLVKDDIHTNIDGSKSIFKRTQKSKSIVRIPLLPPAEELLNKYKNNIYCRVKGLCLPVLTNQRTNAYLKEIADICDIEKNLTFHMSRHTFATLSLEMGLSMESVKAILGHSDLTTTQIYGKITDKKLMYEMEELKSKIKI